LMMMANNPNAGGFGKSTDPIAPTGQLQECILLIEDNEEAMFLVKSSIEEYGNGRYRLEWANCLNDGLKQLLKGGVDLVLLDLGLPESSGSATYDTVRSAAPGVPVLVLTGDAAEETELRVTVGGGADYLVKDQISGSLLLQAIQSTVYSSKIRRSV
jgi:putative two-component system response regulator